MCPPATFPLSDIETYWTDEELVIFLDRVQQGSTPPSNVIVDVNPFEHQPSNLPDNVWYFVRSDIEKATEFGFWKAAGDRCQIYNDPKLIGWRSTLEFYEGASNNGRRTDWVMQQYWITRKGTGSLKAMGSLCRIFPCDGGCREKERQRHIELAGAGGQECHLLEDPNRCSFGKAPTRVLKVNVRNDEAKSSNAPDDVDDLDCFSRGDYLELLDLVNPRSSTSSSCNSSCVSMASDDVFDYLALLNDLEPDNAKEDPPKSTSCSSSISKSSIAKDMVILSDAPEYLVSNYGSRSPGEPLKVEDVPLSLGIHGKPDDKGATPHAVQNCEGVPPKSLGASTSHRSVSMDGKKHDVVPAEMRSPQDTELAVPNFDGASTSQMSLPTNRERPDVSSTEMHPVRDQKGDPPNSQKASSSQRLVTDKGKKPSRRKMKRLSKKYLCFMPFLGPH